MNNPWVDKAKKKSLKAMLDQCIIRVLGIDKSGNSCTLGPYPMAIRLQTTLMFNYTATGVEILDNGGNLLWKQVFASDLLLYGGDVLHLEFGNLQLTEKYYIKDILKG